MGLGFSGFGIGFSVFQILFTVSFVAVFGVFIVTAIKGISQWNKNNHAPRLTVSASIVAKRTNVSRHRHNQGTGMHHTSTSTSYYVTFQFDSGDRTEFHVSGSEYGLLVEGDKGNLTFQGTRYLGFERI